MNLYIASTLCWGYEADEVIEIAKHNQFKGVEIWAEHIWFYNTDPKRVLAVSKNEDISLTLHAASWDLNICSFNEGIQRQSIFEIEKSIHLAKEIGANSVTLHPGRLTINHYLNDHISKLTESLKYLVNYASNLGITLSLELMEPIHKEIITTPVAMNALIEDLSDALKVTLDIAHIPLNEDPLDYLKLLNRVDKIHLSDSTYKQYHVPLGEGNIDLQPILAKIGSTEMPVILEGFDDKKDLNILERNINYLKKHCWLLEENKI